MYTVQVSVLYFLKGIWHSSVHVPQFDFLPKEQFLKLMFVRKIRLHRPCEVWENNNTDIEELFSHLWKI